MSKCVRKSRLTDHKGCANRVEGSRHAPRHFAWNAANCYRRSNVPKDHQAGQQSRRTESRAGIVTVTTVEGTLHIFWDNHIRPDARPRYRLLFDRYKDFKSGAQQSKRLLGKDGLESYLLRIKSTAQDLTKKQLGAPWGFAVPWV